MNSFELFYKILTGENIIKNLLLTKKSLLFDSIFSLYPQEKEYMNLHDDFVPWDSEQNNSYHKFTIFKHTLKTLENLIELTPNTIKQDKEEYAVRNFSAVLHDIGKRYKGIQGTKDNGDTNYHGHEKLSGKITKTILNRYNAPEDFIRRIKNLTHNHLRPHILLNPKTSNKTLLKFRTMEDWNYCIDLATADNLGKQDYTKDEKTIEIQRYEDLRNKIIGAKITSQIKTKKILSGNDLINLGFLSGPIIGEILSKLDPNLTKDEALSFAKQFLDHNQII